jgi:hypothetical protein
MESLIYFKILIMSFHYAKKRLRQLITGSEIVTLPTGSEKKKAIYQLTFTYPAHFILPFKAPI